MHADAARPTVDGSPVHYERRRPELSALYRVVQQHTATFLAEADEAGGLPRYVRDEFDRFLKCGILAHGFLRLRCEGCGHDRLLAFSCKRRGFCPSCGARRMAQTAAHLVDHIFPQAPVRQWVLSLPIPLRVLLAAQPALIAPVLHVVQHAVERLLLKQLGLSAAHAQGGGVTLIQRFGSAANLNIHLHCLILDGLFKRTATGCQFVPAPPLDDAALARTLQTIVRRILRVLVRLGALVEDEGTPYLSELPDVGGDEQTLRQLQAAAVTYRIAFGPRAGRKVLTLAHAEPSEEQGSEQIGTRTKALCAEADGFSLHAGVRCAGHERDKLERLARYVARPALAFERVRYDEGNGHVTLQLKTPWRDGTTHLRMSPLEFMQRLAALVPPARLHLTRFHGVLAPNARLRPLVIPAVPPAPEKTSAGEGGEAAAVVSLPRRASYVPWGKLLRRVFKIDLAHCPCCGGTLRIIAAIMERETIERILNHLKLPAQAPPRTPAFAGGDLLAV